MSINHAPLNYLKTVGEITMDTWEIKMAHHMTLWGIINSKIEYLVTRYSIMADKARNYRELVDVEEEFKVTMRLYGIVVD